LLKVLLVWGTAGSVHVGKRVGLRAIVAPRWKLLPLLMMLLTLISRPLLLLSWSNSLLLHIASLLTHPVGSMTWMALLLCMKLIHHFKLCAFSSMTLYVVMDFSSNILVNFVSV
jgi:hypothetical protein